MISWIFDNNYAEICQNHGYNNFDSIHTILSL